MVGVRSLRKMHLHTFWGQRCTQESAATPRTADSACGAGDPEVTAGAPRGAGSERRQRAGTRLVHHGELPHIAPPGTEALLPSQS